MFPCVSRFLLFLKVLFLLFQKLFTELKYLSSLKNGGLSKLEAVGKYIGISPFRKKHANFQLKNYLRVLRRFYKPSMHENWHKASLGDPFHSICGNFKILIFRPKMAPGTGNFEDFCQNLHLRLPFWAEKSIFQKSPHILWKGSPRDVLCQFSGLEGL